MGSTTLSIARKRAKHPQARGPHRRSRRLRFESLEDRSLLAAFTPGNLVVYRVGALAPDNASLSPNGSPVFLDEYTPDGTLVQSVAMPTAQNGLNRPLVASGTIAAEGYLTRSSDGRYLLLTGYDRSLPYTSGGPLPSTPVAANRVVGRVDWLGQADTSMGLGDFNGRIQTVASQDGGQVWVAGSDGSIKRAIFGFSSSSFIVSVNSDEVRQLHIFNDQLYASNDAGIFKVGAGLPTGLTSYADLPGLNVASPQGFYFADLNASIAGFDTLYVTSDTVGLSKYSLYDGAWTLNGTIGTGSDKYRGLTATVSGNTVTLFAIHSGGIDATGGGKLVKVVDGTGYNGALSGSPIELAAAASQAAFRGVALAPYSDNNAPVLNTAGNSALTAVTQVAVNNPGNSITELIASGGGDLISDLDPGALEGIALIAADNSAGEWQYSLNSGADWQPLGTVSASSARLLAADGATRLRLVPNGAYTGVLSDALRFRAWDRTEGENGGLSNPAGHTGADGAFSILVEAASIEVLAYTNTPPTISAIADQSVNEDGSLVVNFTVGDDGELSALTVTADASNASLLPTSGIVLGGSGANRTIQLTPAANGFGDVTITITVSDGEKTTTEDFVLTITPVNDPPTVSAIADVLTAEDTAAADIVFTLADVETAIANLDVTVESSDPLLFPPANLVLTRNGADQTLRLIPAANRSGSATITVTVTDEQEGAVERSFLATVTAVNDPPTISPLDDVAGPEDAAITDLAFTMGDQETAADEISVEVESDNATLFPADRLSIVGTGANRTLRLTPAANQFGSAVITVTATDGDGTTTTEIFVAQINPVNDAPTLSSIDDQSVAANAPVGPLPLIVDDIDNEPTSLTIAVDSSNHALAPLSRISITGAGPNRSVSIVPVKNQAGSATITLTVSDGQGGEAVQTFELAVAPNVPPTLSAIADQSLDEDKSLDNLSITMGDLETDSAALIVNVVASNSLLFPPGSLVIEGEGPERLLRLTPAANRSGAATITVTVTDENDALATREFIVTVAAVNDAPIAAAAVLPLSRARSEQSALPASDVDGPALTYTLTSQPRKGILTITNPATGEYLYRPYQEEFGPDSFTFQVSDGIIASNVAQVQVAIAPFAGAAVLEDGTLTVTGTPDDDYIFVTRASSTTVIAVVNTQIFGPFTEPALIRLVGGAGRDVLLVQNLTIPSELNEDEAALGGVSIQAVSASPPFEAPEGEFAGQPGSGGSSLPPEQSLLAQLLRGELREPVHAQPRPSPIAAGEAATPPRLASDLARTTLLLSHPRLAAAETASARATAESAPSRHDRPTLSEEAIDLLLADLLNGPL